jgi:hypothetical protein
MVLLRIVLLTLRKVVVSSVSHAAVGRGGLLTDWRLWLLGAMRGRPGGMIIHGKWVGRRVEGERGR